MRWGISPRDMCMRFDAPGGMMLKLSYKAVIMIFALPVH